MRKSIRIRLSVAFIALAIVPLFLVGAILAWRSFTIERQQALTLQGEVARRVAIEVKAFLEELEKDLRLVSRAQELPELDSINRQSLLKLLITQNVFEDVVLLDRQGQEQLHLSRLGLLSTSHGNYAEATAFLMTQTSGQVYYSPVRFEKITGEPLITIAVPLIDIRTGQVNGVLASEIRMKKIWDVIADVRVSSGQSVYIIDAQEKVVAHRNPSVVLRDTHFSLPERDGIQPGLNGERTVLAIETIHFGEQTFHVVAEQIVSEALALAIGTVVITASLIVAALLIAGGLGFVSVRRIIQPIQAMAATAEAISAGDLSQQVNIADQDELGVLAIAFNSMTAQLRKIIVDLEGQISERQQAEEALKEKTEELDRFFSVALDLLCIADTEGYFRRLNPQWGVVLGYSLAELEGQRFLDLVHPDDQSGTLEALSKLNSQQTVLNFVNRYRCKDGSHRWIEWRASPVGELVYAAARDITNRRQTELMLQERNRLINTLLEHAPLGFALNTIDDEQIVFMNRAFEEIYGISHESVKTVDELFDKAFNDPALREEVRGDFRADTDRRAPSPMRWENVPLITTGGEHKFTTGIIIPLWDQNLMIATVQDVTERKQAEDEIRRLNAELEDRVAARTTELEFANQELKDFAYVVSHDLKAPLRAISRLASWLRTDYADAFDDQGNEMVGLLLGRVSRMDDLIDGILEYSRIGRKDTMRFPVDFDLLVRDVLDSLAPPGHIRITVANGFPTLSVEKTRIFQIFQNLIGNAIKFLDKPQGEIDIRCEEEAARWKFCVADNGPGIDPKYHERIFQIFQTLHSRDELESTGIGLAIVKKIVERHGGTIWLESAIGEGCRFFFTLAKSNSS